MLLPSYTVFGRSNVEIAGSNPAPGMDVCLSFSVLCGPVLAEALSRTNHPSKESYQLSKEIHK
jgi:hypothetical protein